MPGQNFIGPFGPGVNETYVEPDAAALGDSGGSSESWFRPCSSPGAVDGTRYTAQWANRIMKQLRRACDGMGIARNETDGDRLLKAIQKADRPIENIGDGVAIYAGDNGTTGARQLRSIKGAGGIAVGLSLDADGDTYEVVIDGSGIVSGEGGDGGGADGGGLGGRAVFATVGVHVWTVPEGVTVVDVEVWGGGGAGGNCGTRGEDGTGVDNGAILVPSGGGGASGGYTRKRVAVTPGSEITVTVGAGGVPLATNTTARGGTGGTSSFGGHCSATGGNGGNAGGDTLDVAKGLGEGGDTPGVGSSGDLNLLGARGACAPQFHATLNLNTKFRLPGASGGQSPVIGLQDVGTVGAVVVNTKPATGGAGAADPQGSGLAFRIGAAGGPGLVVVTW